jgi:hypothetical protein
MKLNIFRFVVLAAVALILGSITHAQAVNVRAQVPFNFVLGDRTYPAGDYSIQTLVDYSYSLRISNREAKVSGLSQSYPITSAKDSKQTVLIFARIGNSYFLHQVRTENSSVGRQFRRSRMQAQMALNGTQSGTVVIAANMIH